MKRIEDSLRDLWDNIKHNKIRIIRVPEEEERESEKIFEENGENTIKVQQGPRRTKEQTNSDEQHNK